MPSCFKWLKPNGGWAEMTMEVLMNLCDRIVGTGNWYWAQMLMWVVTEGVIVPKMRGADGRSIESMIPKLNGSFYQGVLSNKLTR